MALLNKHFRSPFTVDNVIFGFDDEDLKVLLIKRGEDPFENKWALPGYFVKELEDLDTAANRVLEELTGLQNVYLEQVQTFGKTNRHPSGRVITIAYYSLIKISDFTKNLKPGSIAQTTAWFSLSKIQHLPFDHSDILQACFQRLQKRVRNQPVGFELLPPKFTLSQLQSLYEAILNIELDKRNFRKKILSMDLLIELGEYQEGVAHRPAKLYEFDKNRYKEFLSKGYVFDLSESKKQMAKVNGYH